MLRKSHFSLKREVRFALLAIPVVSLLILLYNLGDFRTDFDRPLWVSYLVGTFFTGNIWAVNLMVFHWVNEKFSGIHQTQKRIVNQMAASAVLTFLAYVLNVLLFTYLLGMPCTWEVFVKDLKVTYLVTLMVTIYYHSAYYFRQWKSVYVDMQKLRKESVLAQYESLRNQVNPHFLFNCLNTLAELVHSDSQKAEVFIQKLSEVYRYLLNMHQHELATLEEEIRFIRSYLFLVKTRFGENIVVNYRVPDWAMSFLLPPVCLQMLIENAIKHNTISKSNPLQIEISVEGDWLVVSNNINPKLTKEESTGIGLRNIANRYTFFSEKRPEVSDDGKAYRVKLPMFVQQVIEQ